MITNQFDSLRQCFVLCIQLSLHMYNWLNQKTYFTSHMKYTHSFHLAWFYFFLQGNKILYWVQSSYLMPIREMEDREGGKWKIAPTQGYSEPGHLNNGPSYLDGVKPPMLETVADSKIVPPKLRVVHLSNWIRQTRFHSHLTKESLKIPISWVRHPWIWRQHRRSNKSRYERKIALCHVRRRRRYFANRSELSDGLIFGITVPWWPRMQMIAVCPRKTR